MINLISCISPMILAAIFSSLITVYLVNKKLERDRLIELHNGLMYLYEISEIRGHEKAEVYRIMGESLFEGIRLYDYPNKKPNYDLRTIIKYITNISNDNVFDRISLYGSNRRNCYRALANLIKILKEKMDRLSPDNLE